MCTTIQPTFPKYTTTLSLLKVLLCLSQSTCNPTQQKHQFYSTTIDYFCLFRISYKQNHKVYTLQYDYSVGFCFSLPTNDLAYFSHNAVETPACYCMYWELSFFSLLRTISSYKYTAVHFVFFLSLTLGCFHLGAIMSLHVL